MPTPTRTMPPVMPQARYEDDLYSWTLEQVALLRARRSNEIDTTHIIEELLDVGRYLVRRLQSSLAVLAMHLLKWDYQPAKRSRSWALTVREQRRRISELLEDNPGLQSKLVAALEGGYADGRDRAIDETLLPEATFPQRCPYSFDEIMTRTIEYAEPAARSKSPRRRQQ